MMIQQIFAQTPIWVFGLFMLLIAIGLRQSRTRRVRRGVVFGIPMIMVVFSYLGLKSSFGNNLIPLLCWLTGFSATAILGVVLPFTRAIKESEGGRYLIEGSWVPLCLMMGIFFTKFSVGMISNAAPMLLHDDVFIVLCSLAYGLFSGMFASRALSIWRTTRHQPTAEATSA